MTQSAATLLVIAAGLLGVAVLALSYRRDALGAIVAGVLGFDAVISALLGFAGARATALEAAQLEAFAILVELLAAAAVAAAAAMAVVLRRRSGDTVLERPELATNVKVGWPTFRRSELASSETNLDDGGEVGDETSAEPQMTEAEVAESAEVDDESSDASDLAEPTAGDA